MEQDPINVESKNSQMSIFDKVIEALLIVLLAFMPLAFGAVEAWSEQVVVALAAAISLCFLLKLIFERTGQRLARSNPSAAGRLIWSWAYVPAALFILVVIFQLIPLPASVVSVISPNTAATKTELLGDLPNAGEALSSMTLTFYANATRHNLRLVLAVAAVFLVVLNVYHRPDRIKRLLAAIAIIGGSIAVLALAQDLFGNGKIYWLVPAFGQAHSGTFINHSHYGQFMNLSIGAALGLILVKVHEAFTGRKVTPRLVSEYISSPAAKTLLSLTAMVIAGVATVFVSLTRGGMASMLIAAGFTVLVLSSRKSLRGRGWIMVLMALGAFICVLYLGFDAVYDRLATLQGLDEYKGRWQIVKDIAVAWTRFPVFGTGLGTHEVVYPMFDRSTIPSLAAHAENEYAQAAEETGLVGFVSLMVFGIIVWVSYVRNVTSASVPIRSAAYGLGFGLLAIMIHSLSDFGQHLPANAMLSAVSCALLLGLARQGRERRIVDSGRKMNFCLPLSVICLLTIGVAGVWIWAFIGANSARVAEAHWKKALIAEQNVREKDQDATDEDYVELISNAAAAAHYQPDDVKYRHWLNVYRWQSISRITDPNTGAVILPEQSIEFVRRIVDELHNARMLCPTYGATYCVVGQLERFILNDPNGAERIMKGYRLAPCDSTACFIAGLLDAEEDCVDASFAKLSRAVQLDSRLFAEVAGICVNHLDRPDLAVKLAGHDAGRLSQVANLMARSEEHQALAEEARAQVARLLKAKGQEPDAPAGALASLANIYRKEGDNEAAIEHYRRALALDYGQVHWRFALATLLAETGRITEAVHEARICLRLRPQFKAAERLIEDLSVLPGAVTKENPSP